jgi:hypothetical protein
MIHTLEDNLIDDESHFTYRALDLVTHEIRVVRLKPLQHNRDTKADEDLIICALEQRPLEDPAGYIALSYAWGSGAEHQKISLAGSQHVTSANLVVALRYLRHETEDVVLWIDQLCINQKDDVERGAQVQMMKNIYENAERVISWIGVPANYSDVVLITLRHMAHQRNPSSKKLLLSDIIEELENSASMNDHGYNWDRQTVLDALRVAIPAFSARSYWRRLWVLQEYVVATKLSIKCGMQEISDIDMRTAWNDLAMMVRRVSDTLEAKGSPESDIMAIAKTWQHHSEWWDAWLGITRLTNQRYAYQAPRQSKNPLIEMIQPQQDLYMVMFKTLTTFSGQIQMLSSDPRDRVFSLLGLASDSHLFTSFPDYTRSTESIYEEVTRIFFTQGHYDVLGFCQEDPKTRARNMPSWAVDWSLKIRLPLWGKIPIDASNGPDIRMPCSILDDKTIQMSGSCVGVIQAHGPRWTSHDQPLSLRQMHEFLQEIRSFCYRSSRISDHEKDFVCAQIAAPAALAYLKNKRLLLKQYQDLSQRVEYSMHALDGSAPQLDLTNISIYEKELRLQLFRCPVITDTGYVGIASPHVQQGDLLCIFPGASSPYLIRKQEGDRFTLVGGAHVHGIMNGEYLKSIHEVQSFTLI